MPSNLPLEVLLRSTSTSPFLVALIRAKVDELAPPPATNDNEDANHDKHDSIGPPRVSPSTLGKELRLEPKYEWQQQPDEDRGSSLVPQQGDCLFAEMGQFITQSLLLTSKLASALANGEHVGDYIDKCLQESSSAHDLSNLEPAEYLTEKDNALKKLASQLEQMANDINTVWNQSPKPPSRVDKPTRAVKTTSVDGDEGGSSPTGASSAYNYEVTTPLASERNTQQQGGSSALMSPSNELSPNSIQGLQEQASNRGKGDWRCPLGLDCTKGGVRDGQVIIFSRNSAFRAHLQKHDRAFKCDIPGCRNRAGFARIDQLKRHHREVHHIESGS